MAEVLDLYSRETAPARTDWDEVRLEVMKKALSIKFSQNPDLRDQLMSTGDRPIYECSPTDTFWGIGSPSPERIRGENQLGKLLEETRLILQNANF